MAQPFNPNIGGSGAPSFNGQPIKHFKVVILLRCGLSLLLLEAPVEHLSSSIVSHAKVAKAILLGDLLLHVQTSEKRVV